VGWPPAVPFRPSAVVGIDEDGLGSSVRAAWAKGLEQNEPNPRIQREKNGLVAGLRNHSAAPKLRRKEARIGVRKTSERRCPLPSSATPCQAAAVPFDVPSLKLGPA
jgi:hypothetical protein